MRTEDKIVYEDGHQGTRVVRGKITAETDHDVTLTRDEEVLTISRRFILKIQRRPPSAGSAEA